LSLKFLSEEFLTLCLDRKFMEAETLCGFALHSAWFAVNDLIRLRRDQYRTTPAFRDWGIYAIVSRSSGRMIGHIGFHEPPDPPHLRLYAPNAVEFGYTIFPEYRGVGYAGEAVRTLMGWCVHLPGIENFVLSIAPDNAASQALARRLGFSKVGEHMDERDGLEDVLLLPAAQFIEIRRRG